MADGEGAQAGDVEVDGQTEGRIWRQDEVPDGEVDKEDDGEMRKPTLGLFGEANGHGGWWWWPPGLYDEGVSDGCDV